MTFKELNIIDNIIKSLEEQGYTNPSPIQEKAIPALLNGNDVLGTAQTGTGKTAAFAIPILQSINKLYPTKRGSSRIKALILSPTRELATQIKDSFVLYGKYLNYKTLVIFGGVNQSNQVKGLRSGVDILVATPGRLLDLINQRLVDLRDVEFFVLDEADRMLDMGFINDVYKIVSYLPKERQTMLFSATLPKEITNIANELLTSPIRISCTPVEEPIEVIKQKVYKVIKKDKINLLKDILTQNNSTSTLVFSRTKHGANKIVTELLKAGITAGAIHGNKSQSARELALLKFKTKKIQVLVATDIASRGIDINDLELVINYDLPDVPETYIHRIGRTGRAGKDGVALTFCNPEEANLLSSIEKHIKFNLEVDIDHIYDCSKEFARLKNINVDKNTSNLKRTTRNRGSNSKVLRVTRKENTEIVKPGYKKRSEDSSSNGKNRQYKKTNKSLESSFNNKSFSKSKKPKNNKLLKQSSYK